MIFPEERKIPHINGFFIGPNQRPLIQGSLSLIRRTAVRYLMISRLTREYYGGMTKTTK